MDIGVCNGCEVCVVCIYSVGHMFDVNVCHKLVWDVSDMYVCLYVYFTSVLDECEGVRKQGNHTNESNENYDFIYFNMCRAQSGMRQTWKNSKKMGRTTYTYSIVRKLCGKTYLKHFYYYYFFDRVGYILNITREIDNFFPGTFVYLNIR